MQIPLQIPLHAGQPRQHRRPPKTKAMKRSTLTALAAALPYAQEVDIAAAQAWLSGTVKAGSLTAKTAGRILSFVRGYWRFLKSRGVDGS